MQTFDKELIRRLRYQLVNLISLACSVYATVYRQSLFVQQEDFANFVSLAMPSVVLKVLKYYSTQYVSSVYHFSCSNSIQGFTRRTRYVAATTDWWAVADRFPVLQQKLRNSSYDNTWDARTVWCGRIPREFLLHSIRFFSCHSAHSH